MRQKSSKTKNPVPAGNSLNKEISQTITPPLNSPGVTRANWTKEEINALKNHYHQMPITELRSKLLPRRSAHAIVGQAQRLGLAKLNRKKLTEDELILLQEHYSIPGGISYLTQILECTEKQVSNFARYHGLILREKPWSASEENVLRENYPIEGTGCRSRLPGRTDVAIRRKASKLRLFVTKR